MLSECCNSAGKRKCGRVRWLIHQRAVSPCTVSIVCSPSPFEILDESRSVRFVQEWAQFAMTRTARHKLLKFLKDNPEKPREPSPAQAVPAVAAPDLAPAAGEAAGSSMTSRSVGDVEATWLVVECNDRPGLLCEVTQVIASHSHDIKVSGARTEARWLFLHLAWLQTRIASIFQSLILSCQ